MEKENSKKKGGPNIQQRSQSNSTKEKLGTTAPPARILNRLFRTTYHMGAESEKGGKKMGEDLEKWREEGRR